jgi:protein-L-isoaspartate(D-aspartate) O-methyltransferase
MTESQQMHAALQAFFRRLDRRLFVDGELQDYASQDRALPIGFGQTISQPSLVVQMTEDLDLDKTCRVLEIGTGSGYQTAFLAEFGGQVFSVERIAELSHIAQERLAGLGYTNIHYKIGDGSEGWHEFAPYDRIIVTAGAGQVPGDLLDQLKPGGKLLIPIGEAGYQELVLFVKDEHSQLTSESLGGVTFVEFKGKYGWDYR